ADKTPHEARHTFETLLDNAGGNRKCIDMLMGHKSKDVGNRVYNHKTLKQLRQTIELLH
uniref:tyrosine-type recombinase/integrase n=1 Tax=Faecalibaculum rodentium TaxID=1702221 RepID=UPI0025A01BB4